MKGATIAMKSYRELLHSEITTQRNLREDIEWANYWWDAANISEDKRICLIGDLTARMIRKTLGIKCGVPCDLFATSGGLHDELFVSQLDTFFRTGYQKYSAIFVQLGHHAEIGKMGGDFSEEDYQCYYNDYIDLIGFLNQFTSKVIVESIFYSVIPDKSRLSKIKRFLKCRETWDETVNEMKKKKNELAQKAAKVTECEFLDINNYMITKGSMYRHIDHIHFEENAKKFITEEMQKYL